MGGESVCIGVCFRQSRVSRLHATCQPDAVNRTIDYSPLFATPSPDNVNTYRRATLAARPSVQSEQIVHIIGWVLGGVMVVSLGVSLLVPAIAAISSDAVGQLDAIVLVALLLPGFVLTTVSAGPSYPGAIFGLGSSRHVTDHFRNTDNRYLDFSSYAYVTGSGSGKNRMTHRWGFLALQLDRVLPHLLLDSRANNGLMGTTNLPAVFSHDQVLSLERDALYVFTPDLMALLIDEASPFDVEIVDRWMLVYSARPFPLADTATYQRLLRIVSTIGAKTLAHTDCYVAERVGAFTANRVAPQGQRLRRRVSWVGIAVTVLFLAAWFSGFFSGI